MPNTIKSEIISILQPVFGEEFAKSVTNLYDDNDSEELIKLAHNMLVGYLGEAAANQILGKLNKKYPKLEKKLLLHD